MKNFVRENCYKQNFQKTPYHECTVLYENKTSGYIIPTTGHKIPSLKFPSGYKIRKNKS